jgi:hypothetical protein
MSVLTIAGLAARERRKVETVDIGGAFLNGIIVQVRLNKLMTSLLLKIAPDYLPFVGSDERL